MPSKTQQKDDRLEIRVKPNDKKLLEEAAAVCGISVSSFVMLHSLKAAKDEIGSNNITLSKKDAAALAAMVENPPKANTALKTAFADFRKKYATKE